MNLNELRRNRHWFSFLLPSFVVGVAATSAASTPASVLTRLDSPEPPHRSIFALLEDSDGFLWVGTQDGLARYDGYEMRTLRHDPNDPGSLSSSSIRALLEDDEGRIWVGTESGLNLLERRRFEVRRLATPGHPDGRGAWFHCAFADQDGRLWFGTDDGLLRVDPADLSMHVLRRDDDDSGLTHDAVVAVEQDSDGRIWAVSSDHDDFTMHRLSSDGDLVDRFALHGRPEKPFALLIDSHNRPWLHPSAPLDLGSRARNNPGGPQPSLCTESRVVIERADGSLWFACDDGLWSLDPVTGSVVGHPVADDGDAWLENFGKSLLEDRSGTLWFGTEGGLYLLDPNATRFSHHGNRADDRSSLSADAVAALAETPDGGLWVATYGGGLNRLDRTTGEVERFCTDTDRPEMCPGEVIWHLHTSSDGTLWIAGDGLWSLDREGRPLARHASADVIDPYATFIVDDGSGGLWIGSLGGRLFHFTIATSSLEAFELDLAHSNPENTGRIDSMLLEDDLLWLGFPHALGVFDTVTGMLETVPLVSTGGNDLTSLGTWTIHRAGDGVLRLGTSVGLMEMLSDHRFRLTTTHDGLPGSAVYSIVEEPEGTFWLGTNQGLVRFRPALHQEERLRTFGDDEGTGNTEYNRHAALVCKDGTLAFGGMDGLTLLASDSLRNNPFVPPVRLTAISVSSRDGTRMIEPGAVDRLILRPEDSTVAFEFAALSYTMPELNRYAYRMDGYDSEWTDAGARRTTRYTNLPPGRYRFQVRGSNNDGVWNEEGLSLDVIVLPSLWETWWLRPMLVLGIVAVGWAVFHYREIKKREVERLRMRIAGDLHDDLSSDLSGIAVVADMVRQSDGMGAEERRDLGNIRNASLRMADGLRDIVWYIDPDHDNLEAAVRRMRQTASTLLRGIEHRFDVEVSDRDRTLQVDFRRNVFLIFKEAVHNIVRHAGASQVRLTLTTSGDRLRLEIVDDGCGFDTGAASEGHGLTSMERRAEEIGGTLEIDSSPGRGTTLRLTVGMADSRDGRGPVFGRIVRGSRRGQS